MNAAYIHLTLNHFPLVLNLAAIMILIAGLYARNRGVLRTALALMVAAALLAIPVYLTGEGAEEIVEHLEGVNRVSIHPHEEAAEWAFIMICIEGAAALGALALSFRREIPRILIIVILIFYTLATAATIRTAFLGGKIHHPESEMGGARTET